MTARIVLALLPIVSRLAAQPADQHLQHAAAVPAKEDSLKLSIPDLQLLNQEGEKIHFYTDLVKGKVVAINFIFTTCTTICPPLAATFSKIQSLMGERSGKDFHLISVSVDPATDTPQRLKAWGDKFHRKPGWTLVTGPKPEVDELLEALGVSVSGKEEHTPVVLIGNEATGVWTRAYGLGAAARLAKTIEGIIGSREGTQ